jgi:glycosyltransferase involved in cell wall biosynthesis
MPPAERKLDILFVSLPFSGIEVFFRNLEQALDREKLLSASWIYLQHQPLQGHLWQHVSFLSRTWIPRSGFEMRQRVAALERQGHRFDAVVMNSMVPLLGSGSITKRIPTIAWLDTTPALMRRIGWYHAPPRGRISWWLRARDRAIAIGTYRRARHLLAWSPAVKQSLIEDYRISEAKISLLPMGIDLDFWTGRDSTGPQRKDRKGFSILFVGNDFVRKGGDLLLEVARLKEFEGCRFQIVTRDPVGEHGPNVTVHRGIGPKSPALRALYHDADVFVLPTRADFAPTNVICESLAAGVPVVTTTVGGLDQVIVDGVNGFTVPPDDLSALSSRLKELIDDPVLRQEMSKRARETAVSRFDLRSTAREFLAVVERVTG